MYDEQLELSHGNKRRSFFQRQRTLRFANTSRTSQVLPDHLHVLSVLVRCSALPGGFFKYYKISMEPIFFLLIHTQPKATYLTAWLPASGIFVYAAVTKICACTYRGCAMCAYANVPYCSPDSYPTYVLKEGFPISGHIVFSL